MARPRLCPAFLVVALVSVLLLPSRGSAAPADPPYTVTELSGFEWGAAINASGDVVGQSSVTCGGSGLMCPRAVLYDSDTGLVTELGGFGDATAFYYSYAYGINSNGDAVGSSPESVPGPASLGRATLFPAGGGRVLLPVPDGAPSAAVAINDSGQIAGYLYTSLFVQQAFLYDSTTGGYIDVHAEIVATNPGTTGSMATAIDAAGDVAGWFMENLRRRAFVRHVGGTYDFPELPSGLETADAEPTGINTAGQMVGATNVSSGNQPMRPILWSGGAPQDLGTLPDVQAPEAGAALGINAHGRIVGGSSYDFYCPGGASCSVATHAVLYEDGAIQDLNDLIAPDSGVVLDVATAINDGGRIVAYAGHGSGKVVLLTPRSPAPTIDDIIDVVEGFDLPHGIENSLVTKLRNAKAALAGGDTPTACELLAAFIHETEAQSGKKLTTEQAAELIARASEMRAAIGCG